MASKLPERILNDATLSTLIIGLFGDPADARRALKTLGEHRFAADEVTGAFRDWKPESAAAAFVPASAATVPARRTAAAGKRASETWFGELRDIYQGTGHGEGHGERSVEAAQGHGVLPLRGDAAVEAGANSSTWTPADFEATLKRLQLSPAAAPLLGLDLAQVAAIVTVRAGDRGAEARSLLEGSGARLLRQQTPASPHLTPRPGVEGADPVGTAPVQTAPAGRIQLFGEELRVSKEKVDSDVRVRKESVTTMETVQVPVTREHLVVEHADGSGRIDPEQTTRIPLSEERVHVEKETVLREEYKVGKRETTENRSISGTVQRDRLVVDDPTGDRSQ